MTDARTWRLAPVVLAAAVIAALLFVPGRFEAALAISTRDQQQDFGIFHRGAHCLIDGGCNAYAVVPRSAPNLAPPHAHLLMAPVMWLGRPVAYVGWLLVSALVLIGVAYRVARELSIELPPLGWALVVALAAGSGMMMSLVTSGQIYAVLAWPVTAAWIAWRRGSLARAAVWIALGASVKVLLALPLLWFVVRGHWRAAGALVGTLAAVFLVGIAVFGAASYGAWLEMLSRSPLSGHFRDGALMPALTRMLGESSSFAPVAHVPALIRPLWAALSGVIIALALLKPADGDRSFLALLAAATLAAPIGWIYAAWWFAGPVAAVWLTSSVAWRWAIGGVGLALWLPDTTPLVGQPNAWLTPLVGSLFFWVWIALWGAGVGSARRSRVAG